MIIHLQQPGECATLVNYNTDHILSTLDHGHRLPMGIRRNMEAIFNSDFSHIRIHTSHAAEKIAATLGAAAFTIGHHIIFSADSYHPEDNLGNELLIHELNHTLEHPECDHCIHGWFSTRLNQNDKLGDKPEEIEYMKFLRLNPTMTSKGIKYYKLGGELEYYRVTGNSHEDITKKALEKFQNIFGNCAQCCLLWFCAEVDAWKKKYKDDYDPNFEISIKKIIKQGETKTSILDKLHAFPSVNKDDIGIIGDAVKKDGNGVVNILLQEAIENFKKGGQNTIHGWRLLGISLHVIQDFYAHNAEIGSGLRFKALEEFKNNPGVASMNRSIMEDNPGVDRQVRWNKAVQCTISQLQLFHDECAIDKTLRDRLKWNWMPKQCYLPKKCPLHP